MHRVSGSEKLEIPYMRRQREHTFAAGDHLNDIPMLSGDFARCLVAPDNAIPTVKELVRRQNGYISHQPWGHGVARALEFYQASAVKGG